jgi:hypothetical protein
VVVAVVELLDIDGPAAEAAEVVYPLELIPYPVLVV